MIFLVGIVLMLFPTDSKKTEQQSVPVQEQPKSETLLLEEQLSALLSQLAGAGKVQVLLTEATGQQTDYQENRDTSQSETTKTSTVIVSGSTRGQEGLICQVNPPTYLGAVVLCQGADLPSVRLSITEAVANATGLGYHKISVLKMK